MQKTLVSALFLTIVSCAHSKAAKPDMAKPWTLSIEQRVAMRFDAAAIRQRQDAYEGRLTPAQRLESASDGNSGGDIQYVIEGRRNPELFLPFELVQSLLVSGFSDETTRALNRALYRPGIASLGVDEETFWSTLWTITDRARSLAVKTAKDNEVIQCRVNAAVLAAMRDRYGREHFDKFLYLTIAPHTAVAASVSDVAFGASELRKGESGCLK